MLRSLGPTQTDRGTTHPNKSSTGSHRELSKPTGILNRRRNSSDMRIRVALCFAIVLTIGLTVGEKIDSLIPCRNTSDCASVTALPRETFCKDGYCMCPNVDKEVRNCSSINASIHESRASVPLVFRTCKHDQDCRFQGGFCNTTINQCDCSRDYVPSKNKQRCVEKVQSINSPCTDENQCLAFLANVTCHADKCVCVSGYHYVDDECWRKAGYGQSCAKDQECSHIEGVICLNNTTCACKDETVLNEDGERCLEIKRSIGDTCTESVQCSATFEHSSCIDKTCQCQKGYHRGKDKSGCSPNKGIDAECADDHECYQDEDYENDPPIRSLVCEANRCTCADNYVRETNRCVSAGSSYAASLSTIISLTALVRGLSLW